MVDMLLVVFWVVAFLAVIVIPLNAAAHYDVFGVWPKGWKAWFLVWRDPA